MSLDAAQRSIQEDNNNIIKNNNIIITGESRARLCGVSRGLGRVRVLDIFILADEIA